MFDLIDECGSDLKRYGYSVKLLEKYDMSVAYLKIDSLYKSQKLALDRGEYYIFNAPNLYQQNFNAHTFLIENITEKINLLIKNLGIKKGCKTLLVCLGNPDINADKLGKCVFDYFEIQPLHKNNNIYKFCPNIFFSTGIATFDMVKMLVKGLKIEFVVIIDALTTSSLSRLGTSFQITTNGLTPGSGVNRFGKKIDSRSVGAKCISIGVPFMIFASSLTQNSQDEIILSPKDIKENVESAGYIIAKALDEVLK